MAGPPAISRAEIRDELLDTPDLRVATLIETWVDYTPLFEVGLAPFTFEDRVVTQLRFANQLCFSATASFDGRLC